MLDEVPGSGAAVASFVTTTQRRLSCLWSGQREEFRFGVCFDFLSVTVINTMTNGNIGTEELISAFPSRS